MQATLMIASVVFMAELGCILRSACLVSEHGKGAVFFGTLIGSGIALTLGVLLGGFLGKALPHGTMHWLSGAALICIGMLMMFNNHDCGSHSPQKHEHHAETHNH